MPTPSPKVTAVDPSRLPVMQVKGVGARGAETLAKLGIETVGDLLTHFPRRYEDRSRFVPIAQAPDGEAVTITGKVLSVENKPTKTRLVLTKVTLDDGSKVLASLTYFNQWRMKQTFDKLVGKSLVVYGTVKRGFNSVEITQPEWEEVEDGATDTDSLSIGRIVPVYPATEGVGQKGLRKVVYGAVNAFADEMPDALPYPLREMRRLPGFADSLRAIHFPPNSVALESARRRLVYEELLILQLMLAARKAEAGSATGIVFADTTGPLAEFEAALPFTLTNAQKRVVGEISEDMQSAHPMNRLVQGDVGSGKTAVALAAMTVAVRSGYQAALMAPTEILAEQHFKNVERTLSGLGIRVELLTGSFTAKNKTAARARLASGETDIVVGTHALIQESVTFHHLGLAIVDEQHRFGVMQRAALLSKAAEGRTPDVLVMTATPIPRTLTLTVYGDLDVSIIDELPPGRKPIKTHWKRAKDKDTVYEGIRALVTQGRQAYVVCSLVEENEKLQARAATELASHLEKHVFPEFAVGLLHGQMPSEEKDTAMQKFRANETQILVATTVIEVGVDVPNAAAIIIEDADRFGLAQLHQLRGRVGRGQHASFCILLADPKGDGQARLQVMCDTQDGFKIAEEDLRLRGPGEFYGVRQSGVAQLKIADVLKDVDILKEARADAFALIHSDPRLSRPENAGLRSAVRARGEAAAAGTTTVA